MACPALQTSTRQQNLNNNHTTCAHHEPGNCTAKEALQQVPPTQQHAHRAYRPSVLVSDSNCTPQLCCAAVQALQVQILASSCRTRGSKNKQRAQQIEPRHWVRSAFEGESVHLQLWSNSALRTNSGASTHCDDVEHKLRHKVSATAHWAC
jgi:hypothetical protein